MRRPMIAAVALAVVTLAACSEQGQGTAGGGDVEQAPVRAGEGQAAGATAAGGGGGGGGAPVDAPRVGPTVIKTAELRIRVEDEAFGDAMARATEIASEFGGYVVSSTRGGVDARSGRVTMRVPSERFEAAVGELRGLGDVGHEEVRGEDVGQEFVDLEARLRNLEAQEAVLLRLFDEATTVADTIRIQNELSRVQGEIEQYEGRLRYLRDQTALGTITVSFAEEGAEAPGIFGRAWDEAVRGVVAVTAGFLVAVGYVLPFAVLAGLVLLVVWRVRRRREQPPVDGG